MQQLVLAGGAPGLFVLVVGLVTLVISGVQLARPTVARQRLIDAFSRAVLFSIGAGVAADLVAVSQHVDPAGENGARILVIGIGESLAPAIMGFALLSLISFVNGLSARRLPVA